MTGPAWGRLGASSPPDQETVFPRGQALAGQAVGILVLDLCYPLWPGNVANASTFDFPVLYRIIEGSGQEIFSADEVLLEKVVEAGRWLTGQGARAIIGSCGYFANYQRAVADRLDAPVFLSSLLQIPLLLLSLKSDQKLGVICANQPALSPELLAQCGVTDPDRLAVAGAQDLPEFKNLLECTGHFNGRRLEEQMVGLARDLTAEHPEIGALLLECSDMPPYALAVQRAIGRPVFDFTTLINWVHDGLVRQRFEGFM